LLDDLIARWRYSPFGTLDAAPWEVTQNAEQHVIDAIEKLGPEFVITGDIARHHSAVLEGGAIIKGPAIIGENCFIAAGSLLRGGCFLDSECIIECIIGPGSELKTSFLFHGTKLAHFNFVGDSLVGEDVNLEAGSIVANYRNEMIVKTIHIGTINTHVTKFGAVIGDHARIGANAVIAPGAVIQCGQIIGRLALIDQHPDSE
jgi:UDP-N-acetylglucosamine diphosphorylase / glucose-1-phosphate thymidylyltransferase / UDP-N-acetylgalactosamine diphosphorylase / glucosamine-1-phosphate N-acetyltransferase / galactosamine-1-phosphate N-acetyltransferase